MRKNYRRLLVGSMCLLCLFLFSSCSEAKCPKTLPPGYELEINQDGKYRPIHTEDGRAVFWLDGEGTECEAIERARRQDTFEKKENGKKWKKAK